MTQYPKLQFVQISLISKGNAACITSNHNFFFNDHTHNTNFAASLNPISLHLNESFPSFHHINQIHVYINKYADLL